MVRKDDLPRARRARAFPLCGDNNDQPANCLRGKAAILAAMLFCTLYTAPRLAQAAAAEPVPFSFAELWAAPARQIPAPQYLPASDGVRLAYRAYLPAQSPKAVLVFYHGAGLHSAAGYQHLGQQLSELHGIAVFTPDIRGHGESDGPRGDAPNIAQVGRDAASMLELVRKQYAGVPVFLGGHSAGSALTLNYSFNSKDLGIEGLVLVAPSFGPDAKTDRPASSPFAKTNMGVLIPHAMSRGALLGHSRALQFNYPSSVLARDSEVVTAYTANMAWAIVPRLAGEIRPAGPEGIKRMLSDAESFGLWIGDEDEVFDARRVIELGNAAADPEFCRVETLPATNHMSILLQAGKSIGAWLEARVAQIASARQIAAAKNPASPDAGSP